MNAAKELAERQRQADTAHHELRLRWLTQPNPKWADGEPVSRYDVTQMLRASTDALKSGMGDNSCHCTPPCTLAEAS